MRVAAVVGKIANEITARIDSIRIRRGSSRDINGDEVTREQEKSMGGADWFAYVKQFEFEGVVAKRRDSIYLPRKTSDKWQKQKTQRSDDFLVGGYIPGRYGVEQLVVGEKRDCDFFFVDSVKNGFVSSTRHKVFDALKGKEIQTCPFVNLPEKKDAHRMDREKMATVRWMQPQITAEIAFNERTKAGHLRHSKFLRLRDHVELRKVR